MKVEIDDGEDVNDSEGKNVGRVEGVEEDMEDGEDVGELVVLIDGTAVGFTEWDRVRGWYDRWNWTCIGWIAIESGTVLSRRTNDGPTGERSAIGKGLKTDGCH